MVAYDDLLMRERGSQAVREFKQDSRFDMLEANPLPNKRYSPEGEYSESDSSGPPRAATRSKRRKITPVPTRQTRRATSARNSADLNLRDESDENDFASLAAPVNGQSTRTTTRSARLNQHQLRPRKAPQSSDDELAGEVDQDGDDAKFLPVISDVRPRGRRPLRIKAQSASRPSRASTRATRAAKPTAQTDDSRAQTDDRESSIEFESARRRTGRNQGKASYREYDPDDDFEVVEEKGPAAVKYASVKENFPLLPSASKFRQMHCMTCDSCESNHQKSQLVHCQGCSNSYHKGCLGVRSQREHRATKVGPEEFVLQCRFCVGTYAKRDDRAPDHSMCQVCKDHGSSCAEFSTKKTPKQEQKLREDNGGEDPVVQISTSLINNPDHVLFRCSDCRRGYHYAHLPPLSPDSDSTGNALEDRLEEYSDEWKCKDCLEIEHKVDNIVAWRPVEQDSYIQGQTVLDYPEDAVEYLVKYEGRSHFHDQWMPGAWVHGAAHATTRKSFFRNSDEPHMDTKSAIDLDWLMPDVILEAKYHHSRAKVSKEEDLKRINDVASIFVKFRGLGYEEALWDAPPLPDSPWGKKPWEAFCAAYEDYINGVHFPNIPDRVMSDRVSHYHSIDFPKQGVLKEQPRGLKRGKLMEYQLNGVNWLLHNFFMEQNVILADEMGLGKTIQVVAFITSLVQDKPQCWPMLIVVPNATCANWRRELKHWSPDLRVVTYHGGKVSQDLAYRHELFPNGTGPKEKIKAHVVIMSFESATNVGTVFSHVKWKGLIVDEGQRLKNDSSLLYKSLEKMKIPHRLLLSGTPLQNNARELFNLLQFIDPTHRAEQLAEEYQEIDNQKAKEIHQLIRPYILKRTKAQVLKFLPPLGQVIVPVSMTVLQEKLAQATLQRNPELIEAVLGESQVNKKDRKSLNNILMELRKIICHPYCFNSDVEVRGLSKDQEHEQLVTASGKLMLLNIMLPKLRERGHRVLIFSQFLHNLTILEDFLGGIGLPCLRIDGNDSSRIKQKKIDDYNRPGSPIFAMLLSTRAGGVGINLATADTVIIYDPDYNPHQDLQAISRAHRIGQQNKVLCFQLVTDDSVEALTMQAGRKKMALDHALIDKMDEEDDGVEDVESILKKGAAALFAKDRRKIIHDNASVEKLLDRSGIVPNATEEDESTENQFSFARVWEGDGLVDNKFQDETDEPVLDADEWTRILKQREEAAEISKRAKQVELGRGARRKAQQVNYTNQVGDFEFDDDFDLTQMKPRAADDSADDADEPYSDKEPNEADDSDDYEEPGSKRKSKETSLEAGEILTDLSEGLPALAPSKNPKPRSAPQASNAPRPPTHPGKATTKRQPRQPQAPLQAPLTAQTAPRITPVASHLSFAPPNQGAHVSLPNTGPASFASWGGRAPSQAVPGLSSGQFAPARAPTQTAPGRAPGQTGPGRLANPVVPSQSHKLPLVSNPSMVLNYIVDQRGMCLIHLGMHHGPCLDWSKETDIRMAMDFLRSIGQAEELKQDIKTVLRRQLASFRGQ